MIPWQLSIYFGLQASAGLFIGLIASLSVMILLAAPTTESTGVVGACLSDIQWFLSAAAELFFTLLDHCAELGRRLWRSLLGDGAGTTVTEDQPSQEAEREEIVGIPPPYES